MFVNNAFTLEFERILPRRGRGCDNNIMIIAMTTVNSVYIQMNTVVKESSRFIVLGFNERFVR